MRSHIKNFLGENSYEALREFCRSKGLFFEEFCLKIYDGVNDAYEEEDIISYLGGEDSPYGSNKELVDAIHNEYLSHYDSTYGTWDNIAYAIDRVAMWDDRYGEDIKKEAISFLRKDDESTE